MASCFVDKREQLSSRYPRLIIAIVTALTLAGNLANAAGGYNERAAASVEARTVGESILAIVSLRSQKIIVYDANGWILQAPVSSGQAGRETPAGIFSIALMVLMAYRHGRRAAEIVDLRWEQVDFKTASLHVRR
jgi:hypothetical protein